MKHHTIAVNKTAHYFTLGTPSTSVRQFWIVCHGYAQNADTFIENFEMLNHDAAFVVAPEGFNHFYKKGFGGDVGSNWMTSRYRENQIEDYSAYLQAIYDLFLPQLPQDVRIVLFGFSQGTATVCRWALSKKPHFHDLLLWAGLPPEDLNYRAEKEYLANKNLYLLYGTSDPFLTPDRLSDVQKIENNNDIDFEEKQFLGGHEIPAAELRDFLEKMN